MAPLARTPRGAAILLAFPILAAGLNNVLLKQGSLATAPPLWESLTEEASSIAVILALVPAIIALARRVPPRLTPRALAWHAGASLVFCAVHVALMVGLREIVFALQGETYRFGPLATALPCEYTKDAVAYFLIAGFAGWLLRDATPPVARSAAHAASIEIRTATGLRRIPAAALIRAEACGNYVLLVTRDGRHLHRASLREIEALLPAAEFARCHRSHLVRLAAIEGIGRGPEGERMLTLGNGERVPLSRRHGQARDWTALVAASDQGPSAKATT